MCLRPKGGKVSQTKEGDFQVTCRPFEIGSLMAEGHFETPPRGTERSIQEA